jgi:hypothetical protein
MRRITKGVAVVLLFIGSAFAQHTPAEANGVQAPAKLATWQPPSVETQGRLTTAALHSLPSTAFAFPRSRKEPLTDASHVRSALARFRQVKGVTDEDRELALANIRKAAEYYGVRVRKTDWHQLMLQEHKR